MLKKIIFLLFLTLVLSSCWDVEEKNKITKSYETQIIKKGSITETKGFIWTNFGIKETNIWAKYWWRIISVNSDIGDKVKKWNLLIKLDSQESNINYQTSSNILSSLYSLKKETKNSFDNQVKSLKNKIEQIKSWIGWWNITIVDISKINNSQKMKF
jgi:hypothetical protein